MEVLQLDMSGRPQAWISAKEAAVIYASDGVAWTLGDTFHVLRGAPSGAPACSRGSRSIRSSPCAAPCRAAPGAARRRSATRSCSRATARFAPTAPAASARRPDARAHRPDLARRRRQLDNCITACRSCNGHKGNRLPEEARMSLHYLPYVPSLHEDMILRGRRILADQMEFLLASVPRSSRLHG
jgi:hypothetical protein